MWSRELGLQQGKHQTGCIRFDTELLLIITVYHINDLLIAGYVLCPVGCRLLQDLEVNHVEVDGCGDAQSAAEGAVLGLFEYDHLKSKKKTKVTTQLHGR